MSRWSGRSKPEALNLTPEIDTAKLQFFLRINNKKMCIRYDNCCIEHFFISNTRFFTSDHYD